MIINCEKSYKGKRQGAQTETNGVGSPLQKSVQGRPA